MNPTDQSVFNQSTVDYWGQTAPYGAPSAAVPITSASSAPAAAPPAQSFLEKYKTELIIGGVILGAIIILKR